MELLKFLLKIQKQEFLKAFNSTVMLEAILIFFTECSFDLFSRNNHVQLVNRVQLCLSGRKFLNCRCQYTRKLLH